MRRSLTIIFSLTIITLTVFLGTLKVLALPSESLANLQQAPDLSGKNIYFSEGFGEPSQFDRSDKGISRYASLLHLMGANLFVLDWRQGIPANADLVVIPGPTKDFSPEAIARLWVYIERGGHVLIFVDGLDDKGGVSQALRADKGLFAILWSEFGLRARNDVVVVEGNIHKVHVTEIDKNGNTVGEKDVQVPQLSVDFQTSVINDQHPITKGLAPANPATPLFTFANARSIEIDSSFLNNNVTPLILINQPNIYGETNYADYLASGGNVEYNIGVDSPRGSLFLAAAVENQSIGSRIVLVGDADFVSNGMGFITAPSYSGAFVYPVQANFMVRASAWLLGVEGSNLVFPTPGATGTPTITPTRIVVASPTVTGTLTVEASATVAASPTVVPSPTVTASPTPLPSATHVPSPTATATHIPSPTVAPSATHVPSPTATATHVPSPTVKASSTPEPSATVAASPTRPASVTPTATATP